jgi:hypothetical protein
MKNQPSQFSSKNWVPAHSQNRGTGPIAAIAVHLIVFPHLARFSVLYLFFSLYFITKLYGIQYHRSVSLNG